MTSSDLTATKVSFTTLLEKLSVNTTQVDSYVDALKSYLAIVVASPTQAQKEAMTSKLNDFEAAESVFIQSFEGLSDLGGIFIIDLRNFDFNLKRGESVAAKVLLRVFPDQTYDYFTNPAKATATKFSEFVVAAIAVSDRIKSGN